MSLNMTPLRLSVLRFLSERPNGYSVKGLVKELCPRDTTGGWTEQGAARMAGKMIKPLREAGVLRDEENAPMYRRMARITDAGLALLAEYDEAASRAQLDDAIASAE